MSASSHTATATVGSTQKLALLSTSSAMVFVMLLGLVSLFGDMTYQGGRSVQGQFLNLLGTSAFMVGLAYVTLGRCQPRQHSKGHRHVSA